MWPIAWGHYPQGRARRADRDPHIATLGTLLARADGGAGRVPGGAQRHAEPLRSTIAPSCILVSTRSVNSLVWALLFVAVFGPGALAGTLAIAFRSIGFIGKLFAEALEDAHRVRSRR